MDGLYQADYVRDTQRALCRALPIWFDAPGTQLRLVNLSENATFVLERRAAAPVILRVYRPGYHRVGEITSELTWIEALKCENIVPTAAPIRTRSGARLGFFDVGGRPRLAAAFAHCSGSAPEPGDDLRPAFETLGEVTAKLHLHARQWTRPSGFERKRWDWEGAFGKGQFWGDWRRARGLDGPGRAILERLELRLRHDLLVYGATPDVFGLIHADLRLANLLISDETLSVIDFDDCGFGWFFYDFAAAISFVETQPQVPDLLRAWLHGYRRRAEVRQIDLELIPTLVLMRRLLLTAWLGTHAETATAQSADPPRFTADTIALAERFLQRADPLSVAIRQMRR